jgi:hypothetical protein
MSTQYNDFVSAINPSMGLDGFYALPATFVNFDDDGNVIMEKDEDGDDVLPEGAVYLDDNESDAYRILALRMVREDWEDDTDYTVRRNGCVEVDREEWLVLSDGEADSAWGEQLQNYIDDCLEIPDHIRPYFDEEKWMSDARHDGRGHALAGYDGNEESADTADGTYYAFRQN